jgi:hypothetical protein
MQEWVKQNVKPDNSSTMAPITWEMLSKTSNLDNVIADIIMVIRSRHYLSFCNPSQIMLQLSQNLA